MFSLLYTMLYNVYLLYTMFYHVLRPYSGFDGLTV